MTTILPSVVDEAERLLGQARRDGSTVALLGGIAVRLHADDVPAALDRQYKDIDFAVPKGRANDADKLLRGAGYEPEIAFNAMMGKERMLFHDDQHGRQVDVFVGSFRMCHEIPFGDRLLPGARTVPLAELLLTKLQIVELNEKDVRDT
ncbi:MAG: nucleotidyltransferase family protein, partial [Solirubrobacteraceae bacterium]